MADYIDRIQALGYPLSFDHYDKQNGNKHFINGVESYGEYIDGLPSVDAVEVVRCKDCKYASMTSGGECKYCKQWETEEALYLDGNFFCKWGEKE